MASNDIPWKDARAFLARMQGDGWRPRGLDASRPQGKYGNQATWVGEIRFMSKREAQAWQLLQARLRAGELVFPPLRQVPIHLPGKTRYVADFLYQERATGRVVVADAKGFRTKEYKTKRRMVLDLYGIVIEEI